MFESEHKLRHLPFFEEVASHDEGDAAWRAATAGLVVLRLVDGWLQDGRCVVADDGWSVRSVRGSIEAMDDGTPIKSILDRVMDALNEQKPDIHVVVTPLMAYGQALEYDAKWKLAIDVYHSVLAHLHPVEDGDASIAANLRLASCYRNLHRLEEAAGAFMAASEVASAVGDIVGVLRGRVGEGLVAMLKGNLPRAESILDETINRAQGANLRDVRSRALHTRANVAQLRGNYELAIQFAYEALDHAQSAPERDRILGDIAVAFLELGVYSAARDAYLVLSATAQEQYIRWAAALNLLEIASLTGAETHFESYRRQVIGQDLPPYLATGFQLNLGTGYQRFGDFAKAQHHLRRAVALAGEHGLTQFLFQAEEALERLETTTQKPPRLQPDLPLEIEEVARAVREMREAVEMN